MKDTKFNDILEANGFETLAAHYGDHNATTLDP